jgi:hypothetical protein
MGLLQAAKQILFSLYVHAMSPLFTFICFPASSSPIMSLSDLVQHIDAQNEAISRFSGLTSGTRCCAIWDGFWKPVWGAGLGPLQSDQAVQRDGTEPGIALPDHHPIATPPRGAPWAWPGLNAGEILVPSEYNEAERAAVLSSRESDRDVFVVTGQPGIGSPSSPSTARRT